VGGEVPNCDPAKGAVHPLCAGVNTDENCSTSNSSTGAACTQNCYVECGFDGMGLKTCNCLGGVYESCPCPRPAEYGGDGSAAFCTQGQGLVADYDDLPCTTEWEQCVARDAVTGTPRGCVCKTSSETGMMQWFCGSTNNWFALETGGAYAICQGANPDPRCPPLNTDANCNTSNARSGSSCTQDCLVTCGFQNMGLKTCTCAGGSYSQCPCPRPDNYMGAETAPPCNTLGSPDGSADALDDLPCETEWAQCIGNDVVTGNTPRGCACLRNIVSNDLQWYCGSTNRWFQPQ
jgi:hypothetical protein